VPKILHLPKINQQHLMRFFFLIF